MEQFKIDNDFIQEKILEGIRRQETEQKSKDISDAEALRRLTEVLGDREIVIQKKKRSGFFDLPKNNSCTHPEHKPPSHIHIPQGQGYRHVCPHCGQEQVLIPQQISL